MSSDKKMATQEQPKTFYLKFWRVDLEFTPDELWMGLVFHPLCFLSPLGFFVLDPVTVMTLLASEIIFSLPAAVVLFFISEFFNPKRPKFLIIRRPFNTNISRDQFAMASATVLFLCDLLVIHSLLLTWVTAVLCFASMVFNISNLFRIARSSAQ